MIGPNFQDEHDVRPASAAAAAADDAIAIEAKNIGKLYRLYPGQRARIIEWLTFGKRQYHYPFWALDDVSLTLKKGHALGIIGSNGSGKSTLLKMIAGTSSPTRGNISVNGSVAALLELGAGFHGEFSGRQNIRMNAQIFGLTDRQIDAIMDDVIQFAELDRFIDMPVKTYSSGMYARLGFAVASHLNPDILIIDEALSVGDTYFQRKSLDRIIWFREQGKTILFVSHIMPVVQRFCDEVMWLENGKVREFGAANHVIKAYDMWSLRRQEKELGQRISGRTLSGKKKAEYKVLDESWGSGETKLVKVEMLGADGSPRWHFEKNEEKVTIRMWYYAFERLEEPIFGINFHRIDGTYIFGTSNYHINVQKIEPMEGFGYVDFVIDKLHLHRGSYFLSCGVYAEPDIPYWLNPLDWHNQMYEFTVLSEMEAHGIVPFSGHWELQDRNLDAEHTDVPSKIDFEDKRTPYLLQQGWYVVEKTPECSFIWTQDIANLLIMQPLGSDNFVIDAKTNFPDVGKTPVEVALFLDKKKAGSAWLRDNDWHVLTFPLPRAEKSMVRHVRLKITPSWSPKDYGTPTDLRVIGIGLRGAEMVDGTSSPTLGS